MSCLAEPNDMDILVRFSSFLFSRLSSTDQSEKIDEIRQNLAEDVLVLKAADLVPEESEEDSRLRTFAELFKKLAVAEQNRFLSSELNRNKQGEEFRKLTFWFQELEADDQRELIEKLDPITLENVQIPGPGDDDTTFSRFMRLPDESMEDFRVRRFTESCNRLQYYIAPLFIHRKRNHVIKLQPLPIIESPKFVVPTFFPLTFEDLQPLPIIESSTVPTFFPRTFEELQPLPIIESSIVPTFFPRTFEELQPLPNIGSPKFIKQQTFIPHTFELHPFIPPSKFLPILKETSTQDCCPLVLELIKFKPPNVRGAVVPPNSQDGNEAVDP